MFMKTSFLRYFCAVFPVMFEVNRKEAVNWN